MTLLRSQAVDRCPVCGGSGPVLYEQLTDRVFDVPGRWGMRRCRECRSLWLDPRPVDPDLPLAYQSYFTHETSPSAGRGFKAAAAAKLRTVRDVGTDRYIARRFHYPPPRQRWSRPAALVIAMWAGRRLDAEFEVMRLPGPVPGRVLDVGCGDGDLLVALGQRGWDARGVDFDPDAVAVARRRGLNVSAGDLAAQCYPNASFDVVTMSHSLEHVTDAAATLREVRRILSPGGRVVIVTPNASSWLHRRYGADWQPLEPPRHLQIFTRSALKELTSAVGFSHIEAVTTARSANGVARAAWKFRRHGHWDMDSRPSLTERVPMEMFQQWEAWKIRRDPDAGEELVLTAIKAGPDRSGPNNEPRNG